MESFQHPAGGAQIGISAETRSGARMATRTADGTPIYHSPSRKEQRERIAAEIKAGLWLPPGAKARAESPIEPQPCLPDDGCMEAFLERIGATDASPRACASGPDGDRLAAVRPVESGDVPVGNPVYVDPYSLA